MTEDDPLQFSSEQTIKVHDFVKYEIQGLAPDGKTSANYHIVANEGFLYLHEPKLVQDTANQFEEKLTNKTPFYVAAATKLEKAKDRCTQHVDKIDKGCAAKFSLHQVGSYILYRQRSSDHKVNVVGTNTKIEHTVSKVIVADEKRPTSPGKKNKKKKRNGQRTVTVCENPEVAVNTTTSITNMECSKSDRLYNLLQNLMNAKQKEVRQDQWNTYINELRNKYDCQNVRSDYVLHDQSKGNKFTIPKQHVSEEHLFPVQINSSNICSKLEKSCINDINFNTRPICERKQNHKDDFYFPTLSQERFMAMHREQKIKRNMMNECIYKNNLYNVVDGNYVPDGNYNRIPHVPNGERPYYNQGTDNHRRSTNLAYSCYSLKNTKTYSYFELPSKTSKLKDYPNVHNSDNFTKNVLGTSETPLTTKSICTQTVQLQCNSSQVESSTAINTVFPTSTACQCDAIKKNNDLFINTKNYENQCSKSYKLVNRYWNVDKPYHPFTDINCNRGSSSSLSKKSDQKIKAIELKLDKLIQSINTLIVDTKSKQCVRAASQKSVAVNYSLTNTRVDRGHNTISTRMNEDFSKINRIKRNFSTTTNIIEPNCSSSINRMHKDRPSLTDVKQFINNFIQMERLSTNMPTSTESNVDIFQEEINKSNKAKKDIEDIINGHSVNRKANGDAPTKECSTEVTASLSKQHIRNKHSTSEKTDDEKRSTTAVNTEPMGLLALMQVSTETIKQLFSYVPTIHGRPHLVHGYKRYPQYICNICGAGFDKSSQLSEHIQNHELGKAKDCCVCRHVLDTDSSHSSGLFPCKYCGLRFARAYCCELHQDACARRFGKRHDVATNLIHLR